MLGIALLTLSALVADFSIQQIQSVPGLGAMQGVTVHDGRVYLYGDANTGVIREYEVTGAGELAATGRSVSLTVSGRDLITHPTGLTYHRDYGWFLGDSITATRKGTIYHLDWERMWRTGTLDGAVLNAVHDDLAVQGCRPEFVQVGDRWLLATSDYGNVRNAIRLYDPELLRTVRMTSEAGVLVASFSTGPWVQNLHWHAPRQMLVVIQNITEGRAWRFTQVDLERSVAEAAQATLKVVDLGLTDELEGFAFVTDDLALGVSSSARANVVALDVTWSH